MATGLNLGSLFHAYSSAVTERNTYAGCCRMLPAQALFLARTTHQMCKSSSFTVDLLHTKNKKRLLWVPWASGATLKLSFAHPVQHGTARHRYCTCTRGAARYFDLRAHSEKTPRCSQGETQGETRWCAAVTQSKKYNVLV